MERRKDPPAAPSAAESADPMALWVGTWVPEDVIDRETRRLAEPPSEERSDD